MFEFAIAGIAVFKGQAEPRRGRLGLFPERRVLGLRQIDQFAVISEIFVAQPGMTVEAEALDHQQLEMAHQIVGQEEGSRLGVHHRLEIGPAGIELVAVRAGDAFDAFFGQHVIELPAAAAIAIDHENLVVFTPGAMNFFAHRGRNFLGPVMKLRGDTGDRKMIPAIGADQGGDFLGQRTTGNQQRRGRGGHGAGGFA